MPVLIFSIIAAGIIALDQLSKLWVYEALRPLGSVALIPGVFNLTYAENTGAAFSILQGQRVLLVAAPIIALLVIVYLLATKRVKGWFAVVSLAFISGGALGNFFDRAFRGFVIDMFDFRLINFAVFNVADSFLTVGAVLLCVYILFFHDRKPGKVKDENPDKA